MTVVSDSSPLISLARNDSLRLLPKLYAQILVPAEVYNEVVISGAGMTGADLIARAGWIEVRPVKDREGLEEAIQKTRLGAGEMAAIMLAKEIAAGLTLIDERKARRYAKDEGLEVIGCVGILETLYQRGHLADLRDAYRQLLRHEFRIDRRALQESLARLKLPLLRDPSDP